ncbi:karyopherin/importin-beta family nuclear import receptor Mtr10 [Schizosaccharomyces pombe]|uniref:Uncharacterized protein C11G11.07 n=1 Tax=Schizosaccharomyces pombe (strain 972 / ATCC 24843) TaxID=284812 RepID=YNR7_SCHPO|nr:putative karyopherin Mtr10 [Schizosaccharomyces pombe]Q9USZ2.2 RecName: Full=Uncharacterized protein C11G11.07 [Schizosaccharomyces pombe 972h-]CAB59809.2 karyopherin, nuclear import receptor Mtr10 (predicted) [Schizosaccharomyces pombe]|eukprot:NP_595725.2 putative karyopherin Mtr10 [Schizosaccharomyces pombe]
METLLSALATLYANTDREQKLQANNYLEEFQKSPAAWQICFSILNQDDSSIEAKLFAAQTLRQKIVYDFHQLPKETHIEFRNSLLQLFLAAKDSPRPLLVSLAVCMAAIALHMTEWHNVIADVFQACSSKDPSGRCVLQFLSVLPEEASDPRKTSLSWEELCIRVDELLRDNGPAVLELLVQYVDAVRASGSPSSADLGLVLTSLISWLREIPLDKVMASPLIELAFRSLDDDLLLEDAVEFLCALFNETKDVDETTDAILMLYPRLLELQPKLIAACDDPETFRALGRLFAEAGEAWVVLIARMPNDFLPLVNCIAQVAANDTELEAIKFTFAFWWDLKQMVELDVYAEARQLFAPIYLELVRIIVRHLHYPRTEDLAINEQMASNEVLFEDRDAEDRFRSFRHEMGDVLKDCCVVAGVSSCLVQISSQLIKVLKIKESGLPYYWQDVEAPLFALRAIGRMVPANEDQVIGSLFQILPQLPENNKVRYAATLFLGRYTEWTAQHSEFLELQLNYISAGFEVANKEVQSAAAQALKHFCYDCREQLVGHLSQLHMFYLNAKTYLAPDPLMEVAQGLAHIVDIQPVANVYQSVHSFLAPSLQSILLAQVKLNPTQAELEALADNIDIVTIFLSLVHPPSPAGELHPIVRLFQDIWPILSRTLDTFSDVLICERISKLLKNFIYTFKEKAIVTLPVITEALIKGFEKTQYGCFLWVSGACVRQFGVPEMDEQTLSAVWSFVGKQCTNMFYYMSNKNPKEIPDVIDDFFRLMMDALLANPQMVLESQMLESLIQAAMMSLQLEQQEPLQTVLNFLQDLLAFALHTPPYSLIEPLPDSLLKSLADLLLKNSQELYIILFNGMVFTFPRDNISDASAVLIPLIRLVFAADPSLCIKYMSNVLDQLPAMTIGQEEREKFLANFSKHCTSSEMPRLRAHLQDWTAMYRRRVLTPRAKLISDD